MKISHIKKVSGAKYKIILVNGEEITTYEDTILGHNLLFKKEIDEELQVQIQKENLYYEVYHKTLKYIMTKLRSKKEILLYLEKYPLEESDKENIINKLNELGFLNDEKYARAFTNDKLNLSNYGPDKIKNELEQNAIDEHVIEKVICEIDPNLILEKLRKLMQKKIKGNQKYSEYYLKQKLITEFINLGYGRDQIIEVFEELYTKNDAIIEKEYQKLYKKLSKKYQGNDLAFHLKQKLFQKGFTKEEIERVV